ncbi:transposase [Streptomyces sp. NPDC059874]|uniref:transposase n=1 Tax=Streptomyces sp. NPDC059874 TaxID=3346983 RepID=UPI0036608771
MELTVRRFKCLSSRCPAVTFAEQIEGLTRPHARQTQVLRSMLTSIALCLAGRPGARLAAALGIRIAKDSLLDLIRTACPHLDAAARHVHDFAEMFHDLRGDQLPDWIERVLADDLPALHSLVSGLRRDFDAVTAGLSTPWSSGQVEGHVTRVKLIKRMAYGGANLDLLRLRVLLGP